MNKEIFLKNHDDISDVYMMKAKNTGDLPEKINPPNPSPS